MTHVGIENKLLLSTTTTGWDFSSERNETKDTYFSSLFYFFFFGGGLPPLLPPPTSSLARDPVSWLQAASACVEGRRGIPGSSVIHTTGVAFSAFSPLYLEYTPSMPGRYYCFVAVVEFRVFFFVELARGRSCTVLRGTILNRTYTR